ncbi:unnamed protein product [Candidula unifasciata]|uniref:Glycosyltransferase 2-like domain-containing protein n=1 Tax=Candidula unifasciata TaxID=100452 RepID=A0A8S4AEG6_9EUPU|nr:unnamed protein product [Candidula unifasciata]
MYPIKKRPDIYCWPQHIHNTWLLPFSCVFHLICVILTKADCLLPQCLITNTSRGFHRVTSCIMESVSEATMRRFKHTLSVSLLLILIFTANAVRGCIACADFSPSERYGMFLSIILYLMQLTVLFPLPFFIFNFLGVVLLNVFLQRPKLQRSPLLGPFISFRVVTRGLFPELVNENVRQNLQICEQIGLHSYIFEVVTDIPLNLQAGNRCREIVVPPFYQTPSGSLFKARALQYALEPEVNILGPGDWIVHLDEETVLTEEAVIGIVNFTGSGEYSFGQGVITYGKGKVVNWITTLADSIRVGIDYGCLRFSLGVLHKPVFSWKGSFIVADAEAEMNTSFDHGPDASYAEDCYFACIAFSKGYKFGFIEGDMLEKSTFTVKDFIQQRRRWMHGILLTALSKKIPLRYKVGPILMSFSGCAMPLNMLLFPLGMIWPMPMSPFIAAVYSFIIGTIIYLFILGTLQTFCVQQHGVVKCCLLTVATILCGLIACVLENIASILVFWTPRVSIKTFYVVNKEVQSEYVKVV